MSVEEKRQSRLYNVLPLSLPLCVLKNRKVYAHKSRSTRVYWTAWGALCLTCSVSLNPNNPLIQKIQFSFYRWTGWSTSSLTIRSVHAQATASLTPQWLSCHRKWGWQQKPVTSAIWDSGSFCLFGTPFPAWGFYPYSLNMAVEPLGIANTSQIEGWRSILEQRVTD